MDRERLFKVIGEKYIAKNELYGYLPLGVNADEIWSTVLEQRRAKAITLPLTNAAGQPYWYTLTDKMIIASENIVNELFEHNDDKPLSSVMSIREIYFTGYLEGAQISVQDAMSFLQSGEEPHDVEELMILNNRQAGSFAAENIYRPLNEEYIKVLAQILTNGLDNGGGELRTADSVDIFSMQGENYVLPSAARLSGCVKEISAFLADLSVHPLIKSAVAQAWAMVVRPFPEGNERLGRLLSEIILIRAGYTFFGEDSVSAVIAKSGFKYFDSIAKSIRSDNGRDLTYFLEYYISVLSMCVDEYRKTKRKQDEDNFDTERELARVPLSTQTHSKSIEGSGQSDKAVKDTQIEEMQSALHRIIRDTTGRRIRDTCTVLLGFLNSERYEFSSRDISELVIGLNKEANKILRSIEKYGIIKMIGYYNRMSYYTFNFAQENENRTCENESNLDGIIKKLSHFENDKSENMQRIAQTLIAFLKSGKYTFKSVELANLLGITAHCVANNLKRLKTIDIIDYENDNGGVLYRFLLGDSVEYDSADKNKQIYSYDIIQTIEQLRSSRHSGKKDIRIAEMIEKSLHKGVVTEEDYIAAGEKKSYRGDMTFAKQLGLVECIDERTYRINTTLTPSLNSIEETTKNDLAAMYKIFGDGIFSSDMVVAELEYSSSHVTATLHKLTWLKILHCEIGSDRKYNYQFLITPEDHPECFGTAA